uniref:Uncharacterized protein n=1 Tax=Anopheles darlingi TaxID=43151 RepID=A0A2M4DFM0_ANODA
MVPRWPHCMQASTILICTWAAYWNHRSRMVWSVKRSPKLLVINLPGSSTVTGISIATALIRIRATLRRPS